MKKYYDILEVSPKASQEVIENAFHILVRKSPIEQQMDIREAYRVLSDPFLREQYNLELEKERIAQMENMYHNMEKQNNSFQPNREDRPNRKRNKSSNQINTNQMDKKSLRGMFQYFKAVYENREKIESTKESRQKNLIAILLTILIVGGLLLTLWLIPATNEWIRKFVL